MEHVLIALVVFAGAFTQGVIGFGFGLVCMGLLPLFMPLTSFAVPFVAGLSLFVSGLIAVQLRRQISWPKLAPLLIGCIAGIPLGVLFLTRVDPSIVKRSLGIFLIVYCVWQLFLADLLTPKRISDGWGYLAGAVGGMLQTAFNTGGPPAVVYTTLKAWDKDTTKSTLQVFFTLISAIQLVAFAANGILTEETLLADLIIFPAVPLGIWLGTRVYNRFDQTTFRRGMLALLLVVGVNFAVRA